MAVAGLVLGYLGIAAIPIILIVAAIAIPNLLRARIAANEASAAGNVRSLVTAEVAYSAMHPEAGFTCSLSDLESARLISGQLAAGSKNGYAFELSDCQRDDAGVTRKFHVVAYPLTLNQTGSRVFCSDESAAVREADGGSPQDCRQKGKMP